jgi:SAM-dependent methyltransferase
LIRGQRPTYPVPGRYLEPQSPIRQFVQDYRRLRFAEGYASTDPAFARALPFRDTTGRNVAIWRLRARHYLVMRAGLALLTNVHRVLDVGAGNGWLARRLAARYRVTALDVDATDTGLAALDDPRVGRIRGELEALPVRDGTFDVVIVAAALHYAVQLSRALSEIARVLRAGGVLIIADSPFYSDALARHRAWQRTLAYYQAAGVAHLAGRYQGLTRAELDGPGLFRFVTLSPGYEPLRAALGRWRGRETGPRMPVVFGWKR